MDVSFFAWYGGKYQKLSELKPLIPPHQIYVEPFLGSGALALNHDKSLVEIVNDLDPDIANLFRVMADREKGAELCKRLCNLNYSKEVFSTARDWSKKGFPGFRDVERAVLTFVLISQSFAGKRSSFSDGKYQDTNAYRTHLLRHIPRVYEQLESVKVYNLDALELIEQFLDKKEVFIYLDPPYRHCLRGKNADKVYAFELSESDHIRLLKTIQQAKCKVLVSGYKETTGTDLYDQLLLPYGWKCQHLGEYPKTSQAQSIRDYGQEYVWLNYEP